VSGFRKGTRVRWNYAGHAAEGNIVELFDERVTRELEGSSVTRNGSPDDKALLIEQDDGDQVLKLESEVERI
jgi:hypothetical protein